MTAHTVRTVWFEGRFLEQQTCNLSPGGRSGNYLAIDCGAPRFYFDKHPPLRPPQVRFNTPSRYALDCDAYNLHIYLLWLL